MRSQSARTLARMRDAVRPRKQRAAIGERVGLIGSLSVENAAHVGEGAGTLRGRARCHAVGWYEHLVSAHVGVLRREKHADIREQAAKDERPCPEMLQGVLADGLQQPVAHRSVGTWLDLHQ